jgi:hypothetical protein
MKQNVLSVLAILRYLGQSEERHNNHMRVFTPHIRTNFAH